MSKASKTILLLSTIFSQNLLHYVVRWKAFDKHIYIYIVNKRKDRTCLKNYLQFLTMIILLFVESVCMDGDVYLRCPYRQSIVITNILYQTKWNIFELRLFNPFVCKTLTNSRNDCKYTISYQHLQDQCIWEDTCTVIMNYNPCSSAPLLYATIYYECSG